MAAARARKRGPNEPEQPELPELRSSTSPMTDAQRKRRFVWPEKLHSDFVAAIFDLGLKHATADTILASINDPQNALSIDDIREQLEQYRTLRLNDVSRLHQDIGSSTAHLDAVHVQMFRQFVEDVGDSEEPADNARDVEAAAAVRQEAAQVWQSQLKFLKEAVAAQEQYMMYVQQELAAAEGRDVDSNGHSK